MIRKVSRRAIERKKIAVVGGGPGGLTLARLLQQSGAHVLVYERDPSRSARVQGTALGLHEDSGLAALEAAGLIDAFWANHRPDVDSRSTRCMREYQLRELGGMHWKLHPGVKLGEGEILRPACPAQN